MRSSCGRGSGVPSARTEAIDATRSPALRMDVSTACGSPVQLPVIERLDHADRREEAVPGVAE